MILQSSMKKSSTALAVIVPDRRVLRPQRAIKNLAQEMILWKDLSTPSRHDARRGQEGDAKYGGVEATTNSSAVPSASPRFSTSPARSLPQRSANPRNDQEPLLKDTRDVKFLSRLGIDVSANPDQYNYDTSIPTNATAEDGFERFGTLKGRQRKPMFHRQDPAIAQQRGHDETHGAVRQYDHEDPAASRSKEPRKNEHQHERNGTEREGPRRGRGKNIDDPEGRREERELGPSDSVSQVGRRTSRSPKRAYRSNDASTSTRAMDEGKAVVEIRGDNTHMPLRIARPEVVNSLGYRFRQKVIYIELFWDCHTHYIRVTT